MAIGIAESLELAYMKSRIEDGALPRRLLDQWHIPFVRPVGGRASSWTPAASIPTSTRSSSRHRRSPAQLYLESGVRSMERGIVSAGRDATTGENHHPSLELVRLTIPRRVFTQAHMDVVAESVKACYDGRAEATGLRIVVQAEVSAVLPGAVRALGVTRIHRRMDSGRSSPAASGLRG